MTTAILRRIGGSVMVAIPPAFLDQLKLEARARVEVALEGDHLTLRPAARPRYRLAELLAQCDADALPPGEDVAWTGGGATGVEII